ncbi:MAG: DUF1015 family protein [Pyrinomonadaceae bacterium]
MAIIKPFRALRPPADKARLVSCVPYDVVYDAEVREIIGHNELSFLRVTRSEGEFAPGSAPSPEKVFERSRHNLEQFIKDGILIQDPEPAIYVYQLASGDHLQTGVVACCSIDDYDAGVIKKHEKTRPDKVADRTGHMLAVGAQTGLIFLAFRNTKDIRGLIAEAVDGEPLYSFTCPQGVGQKVWRITKTEPWVEAFDELPAIYIADGHHRAESAKLARDTMRAANPDHTGDEEYNFVVAGIFPAEDLAILPYNRVVKDLNGLDSEAFFTKVRENFILAETLEETPEHRGEMCMYIEGEWFKLRSNMQYIRQPDPIESLDVSVLQNSLLSPVLGIGDPRTDTRIAFVGGARGTAELKKMVDRGEAKVAFSMFPTTMDDLFAVSDMGEIMPPKSTWFEPKLKDGLLVHQI